MCVVKKEKSMVNKRIIEFRKIHIDLVHSGCYNKNIITWVINNINLFLTVLEVKGSKIKASTDLVSSESLLLSLQMAFFSLCPCMVEVVRELSGASFLVVLIL